MTLRPIAESAEADDLYGPFMWGEVDLYESFVDAGRGVAELVPECVGISVSLREHGVTLTLVASEERVALLDERRELVAAATRCNGIEATLSLPVPWARSGAIGFNLYAATPAAFDGHQEELADLLGASAEGAVEDADLGFASQRLARRASEVLRESTDLAVVSVLLAHARGVDVEEAEERLREAAVRAAIPLASLVDVMRWVLPEP